MATRASTLGTPRVDLQAAVKFGMMAFAPIGLQLLTPFATMGKKGALGKIPVSALYEVPDVKRKSKSGANRSTWDYSELTYSNQTYAHEELDNQEESAEFESYFNYEVMAAQRGIDIINRAMERRIMSALHNTTTFAGATNTAACTVEWDTAATADPIGDVTTALTKIRAKCGMTADTLQISWQAWRDLSKTAQLRGALQYTAMPDGFIPLDAIASALGVKRVIVPADGNIYNSANEGATAVLSEIWDKEYAFLAVTNAGPDPSAPCIGRTFYWNKFAGLMTVDQYEEPQTESLVIRAKQCVHEKVIGSEFGFLLSNCHT